MVTTGPTHSSSISHCNSAGCNHSNGGGGSRRPSAPPPPVPPEAAADAAAGEDGDDDEDEDDFIDEDNPLLLDQVGTLCDDLCASFKNNQCILRMFNLHSFQITEDEFKEFESGMAVSRYDGRGNHVRVSCCSALMKECLEVIDAEASHVLQGGNSINISETSTKIK